MKNILLGLFTIISISTFASEANTNANKRGDITGTIIDGYDSRAIEYATIALYKSDNKELVTGGISDSEGFFRLKGNPQGNYYLTITFMGYKTKDIPNIIIEEKTKEFEIGNIILLPNNTEIEEVAVIADQAAVQYKIDKKVVNVSQQLTAKSGTAVDILENVPSVKVDIEGNVSLRGSGEFTVLIDGRPTVLDPSDALSQIPATAIDNIEIITNPSAKYEPDGTAGIINIITKKNKLNGFSGIINANSGTNKSFNSFDRYGGDFTLDMRQENFHFYLGGDYNVHNMEGNMEYNRDRFFTDTVVHIASMGDFERNHSRGGLRAGADWSFTKADNIGINVRVGNRDSERNTYKDYEQWKTPSADDRIQNKTEDLSSRGGMFYSTTLDYKHTFNENTDHYLQFQTTVDGRNSDEKSNNYKYDLTGLLVEGKNTTESGPSNGYQFKLDYSQPFAWGAKLESGAHINISNSKDDNEVFDYDTSLVQPAYVYQSNYSNTTKYKRNTYAAYSTFGGELGDFGYQGGLRIEYTDRLLELVEKNESFKIERPDLFPTLHFSYKLPADQQTMLSYSRRIVRPRGWYLEPFITYMDAYKVRQGNPDLKPEYVNSFELAYQKKIKKNFISVESYYRITENKIERVVLPYNNEKTISLNTYQNSGTAYALGVELMANYSPFKWYTTNFMADLYDYRITGSTEDLENEGFSWNMRSNNTFKASQNTRFQLDLFYQSDRITAQGSYKGFFSTSIAYKQDFMKRKLSTTLQIRDIFSGWRHEMETDTPEIYEYTLFTPNTPIISLTVSYKLNNYNTKRGQRGDGNGGDVDEGGDF
ncbi:MAG: TonB-dependent receptor [Salinivirgaceae bacterium]|nr:TonB-dependent receptor [Salinivirgaceae bacterium]